jgi:AAA domain
MNDHPLRERSPLDAEVFKKFSDAAQADPFANEGARLVYGSNTQEAVKPLPETKRCSFKPGHSLTWYANRTIDHEQTLLGSRYLCRGGGMCIVAPSGMGKSTLSLQMAILWCTGLVAFGIKPRKALRILIIQSEDDEGDCTEMAAVKDHLELTDQQKEMVDQNTELIRCNHLVGYPFIAALRKQLQEAKDAGKPFDLVIINPYGVYLGADIKDTDACTQFLNEWLNPLLSDFEIGAILIHHTAKTNFQNTDKYSLWDWAYHGAGAACITNWARAILAIKPETEDMTVFRFIAAKRGKRIGEEWEGKFERYFAWSTIPSVMRWEEATALEIAKAKAAKSRRKAVDLEKALSQVPIVDPEWKNNVITKIQTACDVGEKRAREALNALILDEKIEQIPLPNPNGNRSYIGIRQK